MLPDERTDVSFENKRTGHNCWPNGLPLKTLNVEATSPNENVPAGSRSWCQESRVKWEDSVLLFPFQSAVYWMFLTSSGKWQQNILSSCVHALCGRPVTMASWLTLQDPTSGIILETHQIVIRGTIEPARSACSPFTGEAFSKTQLSLQLQTPVQVFLFCASWNFKVQRAHT